MRWAEARGGGDWKRVLVLSVLVALPGSWGVRKAMELAERWAEEA